MPFVKGQSGNPGGMPKGIADIKAMAREHAGAAIAALAEALKDPKQRVAAATVLLDRGFGKPVQEITGADGGPLLGSLEIRYVKPGDVQTGGDAG